MKKDNIISIVLFCLNIAIWLSLWKYFVGFEYLKHEICLRSTFIVFIIVCLFQLINEIKSDRKIEDINSSNSDDHNTNDSEHLRTIITIASSVILTISILVALPIFSNSSIGSNLHHPFLSSVLLSFISIFFGIFFIVSFQFGDYSFFNKKNIRKISSNALIHALGWACICVVTLILILDRQKKYSSHRVSSINIEEVQRSN